MKHLLSRGLFAICNRWSAAARAASSGSNWYAANLKRRVAEARRRENARATDASAYAASLSEDPDHLSGGTYPDGRPVLSDLVGSMSRSNTYQTSAQRARSAAQRQKDYEKAFRKWWTGVETTSGNIERFHAYVGALGGATAAAAGAYSRRSNQTFAFDVVKSSAARKGVVPVYGRDGDYVGVGKWERPDGSPMRVSAAHRRGGAVSTAPRADMSRPSRVPAEPYGGLPQSAFVGAITIDPLNDPKTADDLAFRSAYEQHLAEVETETNGRLEALGLDPMGYTLSAVDRAHREFGSSPFKYPDTKAVPSTDEARSLIERFGEVYRLVTTPELEDTYESVREGLARYVELYEDEQFERIEKEGILPAVREALAKFDAGPSGGEPAGGEPYDKDTPTVSYAPVHTARVGDIPAEVVQAARARWERHGDPGAEFTLSDGSVVTARDLITAVDEGSSVVRVRPPSGAVREAAELYSPVQADLARPPELSPKQSKVALEFALGLGVLHGSYGVPPTGLALPADVRAEYERGYDEGVKGVDYCVVVPHDRAAVFRRARAYLADADADEEGYSPEHLNDRWNLQDWGSAASWATRNQGKGAVYRPGTLDTRAQYSPANLLRSAMAWFEDAMAGGDRAAANAALSYMGDMLVSLSGDRRSVLEAVRGSSEEGEETDEDSLEEDSQMPEFDEDGNEVGGESAFYEDSYADPNARQPYEGADAAFQEILRKAVRQGGGIRNRLALLANKWWYHRAWDDNDRAKARLARQKKNADRKKAAKDAQQSGRDTAADLRKRSLSEIYPGGDAAGASGGGEYDGAGTDRAWNEGAPARAAEKAARLAGDRAMEARAAAERAGGQDSALNEAADEAEAAARDATAIARASVPSGGLDDSGTPVWARAANPLGLAWNADGTFREGGLKSTSAPHHPERVRPPDTPAVGFSVPASQVVFYSDGNLFDQDGRWVAEAPKTPTSGEVFQNGRWYDAATGKTTGAGASASVEDPAPRLDKPQGDLASAGRPLAPIAGAALPERPVIPFIPLGEAAHALTPLAPLLPANGVPGNVPVKPSPGAPVVPSPSAGPSGASASDAAAEAIRARIVARGKYEPAPEQKLSDFGFNPKEHFANNIEFERFMATLPTMDLKREFGVAYDAHLQKTLPPEVYAGLVARAQAVLASANAHNNALFSSRV